MFPFLKFLIIKSLKSRLSFSHKLSSSKLQLLCHDFSFFYQSSGSLVLGLCFEPVGASGDALEFLCVLLGLVVFLVHLYSLLDDVHRSYNYITPLKIDKIAQKCIIG